MPPPTLYLFAGSNSAGKTTFARAYLTVLPGPPRFLNADEMARGLSPFDPTSVARKAGKLLLAEINESLDAERLFGLESTLSGRSQLRMIERAKALGYQVEMHDLWIPDPELAIRRIAQRVVMGGHFVPDADVIRQPGELRESLRAAGGCLGAVGQHPQAAGIANGVVRR